MQGRHTVTSYEQDLGAITGQVDALGRMAMAQLQAALQVIGGNAGVRAQEVMAEDKRLNAAAQEIEQRAVRLIALRQPLADDLRHVISALKSALDLERCGDLAKGIAKRSLRLEGELPDDVREGINDLGVAALSALEQVVRARAEGDVETARSVWRADDLIDEGYAELVRRLLAWMARAPDRTADAAQLLLVAKNLERVGDHCANLAEQVAYETTGSAAIQPDAAPPRLVPSAFGYPGSAALLDRIPHAVVVIEAPKEPELEDCRLVLANAAARDLFRLDPAEPGLPAPLRRPEVAGALDHALHGRVDAEVAYGSGAAQPRFWRAIARPLPSGADVLHALLLIQDETDLRRTERMRADFLANASHELRTPLASLVGFIDSLRGPARDDPEARERFLEIMSGQAWRMTRLVDDLLSLSRIEMNEHVPPSDRVDLSAAARDLLDANGPLLEQRGLQIRPELPGGPAWAVGDRDQVLQVLQNLFDNAAKYARSAITLEVRSVPELQPAGVVGAEGRRRLALLMPDDPAPSGYIAVTVADDGHGIPGEHLSRLTERFYRVEGGRSGTGLGLAIVKHVMNRHRGALTVDSVEGDGAAFTALFPAAEVA